jgi:hypothetical protein
MLAAGRELGLGLELGARDVAAFSGDDSYVSAADVAIASENCSSVKQ